MPATLFIGGMKSGKSALAEKEALRYPERRLYIATSVVIDEEMKKRVELHKKRRENLFDTIEEPLELADVIYEKQSLYNVILIDCLTFWYNNMFYYDFSAEKRQEYLAKLVDALKVCPKEVILVTNEVGMGIIPENRLAREFIDFSGRANQLVSSVCDNTFFVIAGKVFILKEGL